jgi:diguanylate cyclase (GGDEF)-like protein/PAS domain S-box-containing protein
MCGAWLASGTGRGASRASQFKERSIYLAVGVCTLGVVVVFLWMPADQAYEPRLAMHRPAEMAAGFLFVLSALGYARRGRWKFDAFEFCLILFLTVSALGHAVYMSFSTQLFDALALTAHLITILAYVFLLSGLLASVLASFQREAQLIRNLTHANEALGMEVEERRCVEQALQHARDFLEARVAERTDDLAEQGRLAALASEIALVLTEGVHVQKTLQRSAELMVLFLDAAFVRIWTVNEQQRVLELQASAGIYTHLNGPHGRVPLGQFKIGRIAEEGKPHLTNDVQQDPWVSDPEWAQREGMVAFAGCPLIVNDRVVGVVAGFARQPLTKAAFQSFGSLAGSIAQFISRKRAEAALLDSEEKVRLLLDSAAEAIFGIDVQGNCTLANRACLELLRYRNQSDLVGKNMHDLMHYAHADGTAYPAAHCRVNDAVQRGEGCHVDDEVLWRSDGTCFPAEYWSYPVRKDGAIVGAVVTFLDISKRKQAEEALRTSEERFRIASENAGDLTFEWDLPTGRMDMYGLFPDTLGGLPAPRSFEAWSKMVHPDDLGPLLEAIGRHIETGERYVGEYRLIGLNGRIYHYAVRGRAVCNRAGEPYKAVGVVSDITEHKKTEEAIAQLAAIVQSSEDAIISTDLEGRITTWNGGAEKLLGYTSAEAVGAPLAILFARAGSAAEILEPSTRGAVSRLEEAIFAHRDGAQMPVSLTVSPIRRATGQITGAAAIARDISARKKAETELAHQAQHDHLTGLPNRLLLADRLAASIDRAARSGAMTAVIYLDLDGFKFVNDTLGHEAGDELLQQVTERLRACIREPDTLARMGGDEFMLVVNQVPDDRIALRIAERLRAALRKSFQVAEHELYMTASLGIAMYPRDGSDVSTLRRNADAAMYEAKRGGKDRVLFFTPAMRDTFLERLELETELRRALDRNELSLAFQPIYEAKGGRQTAFEALLRWVHPVLGPISPAKFVPVAEESGLIVRLGAWVLQQACRECRAWQERGRKGVRVAVNVSALEFARAEFASQVLRVLDETGLPGQLLDLELTETTLMRDMDDSIRRMGRLRERGIRISIDDFGTGYSSLGYLPRLPVDLLKIDRSFVAELGVNSAALSLIEGMISLAHSIGKRVVVEGVETHEQLDVLRGIGADEIQGFLLGRPAPLPAWEPEAADACEPLELSA